jgi:FkbH-like protein
MPVLGDTVLPDNAGASAPLVIAASFAFDPALEAIAFWGRALSAPLDASPAPYAQILPQLLDPASALRRAPARALALRWSDHAGPGGSAEAAAEELARALKGADDGTPTLALLCPERGREPAQADAVFAQAVAGLKPLKIIDAREAFGAYRVEQFHDERADRAAHIPYTAEAMAVLGTLVARWRMTALRPPVKLIAADGDNTLWTGVLGEDGPAGISCGPGRLALQERLADASQSGQIVGLFSKNEAPDIEALFRSRADFRLRRERLLAVEANWAPKPDNLKRVAASFGVAEESIVFLDDNPVECAEMRAASPGVLTVMTPPEPALARFIEHLWPLDRGALTDADFKRAAAYRDEAARAQARAGAPTLRDFFAGLDLAIDIAEAGVEDFERLAQMTERTNQFNATLQRLDARGLRTDGAALWRVSVRDRFGDYGVVGGMRAAPAGDALSADLFMLSCRALGRGVEHAMTAHLGRAARAMGLDRIAIKYVTGPRNAPARRFLAALAGAQLPTDGAVILAADAAASVAFDPETATDEASEAPVRAPAPAAPVATNDLGAVYARIASELTTGAAILAAMTPARARPDLSVSFAAPAPGLEARIAALWEEALGVAPVGAHDPFRDLGGRSIHLVRIHGLIALRLGAEIDLVDLFRFSTVSALAGRLSEAHTDRASLTHDRAALMRGARLRPRVRA